MLKAVFLDMDETLCDTSGANYQALLTMQTLAQQIYPAIDSAAFAQEYLTGIYRDYPEKYQARLEPIENEKSFRLKLVTLILEELGVDSPSAKTVEQLQECFDQYREQVFDFFPGIKDWLIRLRKNYKLIVITNGPEFSQVSKIKSVSLNDYVDAIIIGGQEPEQKPASSIFQKAMRMAQCQANECIHIGDSLVADIKGAENAGIKSIWIQGQQSEPQQQDAKASAVIKTPQMLCLEFESICHKLFAD